MNACKPPGQWQTYDIIFEAPRWDESGKLIKKACITVFHNGVVLHHKKEFIGETGHTEVANYGRTKSPADRLPCRTTATRCASATSGFATSANTTNRNL